MKYLVSIIGGQVIAITAEQKLKLIQAIDAGVKQVSINDCVVFIHSIASILPADEYIASENRRLNGHGKYMCKHGTVHHNEEHCDCSRESRLTDTPGLITTVEKLECPQCHTLCPATHEFCDACDSSLLLVERGNDGPVLLSEIIPKA